MKFTHQIKGYIILSCLLLCIPLHSITEMCETEQTPNHTTKTLFMFIHAFITSALLHSILCVLQTNCATDFISLYYIHIMYSELFIISRLLFAFFIAILCTRCWSLRLKSLLCVYFFVRINCHATFSLLLLTTKTTTKKTKKHLRFTFLFMCMCFHSF